MKIRWSVQRHISLLILGMMVLIACGDATTSSQSTSPAATEPAAQTTERVVVHAMGETTVPAVVQRVIVLDNGALDNVLALGVTPVGAATVLDNGAFPPYLAAKTADIKTVGLIDQPNLETIASLNPDLILGSKDIHEEVYAQLSQIAPTVFAPALGATWKENLVIQAEALGKVEEGKQLMSAYDQRIADFKTQMGERLTTTEVSIVRSMPDHLRIYMNASFIGTILKDTGIGRPVTHNQDKVMEKISNEQISSIDGSVIFFAHRNPAESQIATIMKEPLWQTLNAVQAGNVHEVPHDVWISGLGIQSANLVLDDLTRVLVEKQS